ncbi:hypothetical protein [Micromonospora sp. NPDC005087]|uniref:hypothetical protein n=1 Tax=Micromonospora sp. NPDC005087 TaxID=3364225 RepID=UPI00367D2007
MHVELGVAQNGQRQRDGGPPVGVLARVQPLASDDPRPAVPAHVLHQMYRADPVEGGQEHPAQRAGHRGDAGPVDQRLTARTGDEEPEHVGGGVDQRGHVRLDGGRVRK